MLRKFLLATVATVAFAGAASAADMPARMATKAVPFVQMYNWTGFYAGVNLGYGWGRASDDFGVAGNLNGVIGGGQIGYNWQMNNLVVGIETDFQGSGQRQSWAGTGVGFTATGSDRIRYFGTVRGRLGYAFDRTLLYVTGGYAYTNVGADASVTTVPGGVTTTSSSNTTKSGYALGAGLEYAFAGPWTAKAEYLYVDSGTVAVSSGLFTDNLRIRNHIARVGINYRF
jgi:outer membrane immunogenic protein